MTEDTKTDASITEIAERLSFFFSDVNLRGNKYLRGIVMEKGNDGFCTIDTLLKFDTLKKMTSDAAIIAKAAESCEKLKLNDEKTSIARVEPFTWAMIDDNVRVSLRINDIPVVKNDRDIETFAHSSDEVKALFEKFGKVSLVRLITDYDKKRNARVAKGKGFVEFESVKSWKKAFSALCLPKDADKGAKPKRTIKLGGNKLRIQGMQDWLDERREEAAEREKSRDEQKQKESSNEKKRPLDREEEKKQRAEIEAIEFKCDWKKGCVIKLKGIPSDCDREKILAAAKSVAGEVTVYADYSRGDKDGKIRFFEPSDKIAELVTKLNDGSVKLGDSKVKKATLLEGRDEEKYHVGYAAKKTKMMRERAEEKLNRKVRRKCN